MSREKLADGSEEANNKKEQGAAKIEVEEVPEMSQEMHDKVAALLRLAFVLDPDSFPRPNFELRAVLNIKPDLEFEVEVENIIGTPIQCYSIEAILLDNNEEIKLKGQSDNLGKACFQLPLSVADKGNIRINLICHKKGCSNFADLVPFVIEVNIEDLKNLPQKMVVMPLELNLEYDEN